MVASCKFWWTVFSFSTKASSAVVETVDNTGNTLGNTVQKVDDGVKKILLNDNNDDEKGDDDGGDSKDSDDDEKGDDDGGDSLKDTVKKILS